MSGRKVIPIYRKVGPKGGGDDSYERARDVESVMDALPQIVAVVEAAERAAEVALDQTQADRHAPILRREVAPALAALDEALS